MVTGDSGIMSDEDDSNGFSENNEMYISLTNGDVPRKIPLFSVSTMELS